MNNHNWRDREFDEVEELRRELRLILAELGRVETTPATSKTAGPAPAE